MPEFGELVEGSIIRIDLDPKAKAIRIFVRKSATDNIFELRIDGVKEFVAEDVKLSNIIESVECMNSSSAREQEIYVKVFASMRSHLPNQSEQDWEPARAVTKSVIDGHLVFLEIQPVYGALISAIAERVELRQPESC